MTITLSYLCTTFVVSSIVIISLVANFFEANMYLVKNSDPNEASPIDNPMKKKRGLFIL